MPGEEILIETTRVGNAIEVRAIDASDGLEVSFMAPANASQADIKTLAVAKLAYVRSRRGDGGPKGGGRGGVLA
jgi:hypothetical protein